MTDSHMFAGLRERLGSRLGRVIGNPVIERKELAAFDLVVSRRQVMHGSGIAAVTALVAAGTPPTMWGRQDSALAVDPATVGLTQAEQVSVTAAVALSVGSETFQDTVYAEQVVSAEAVNTHAVVEGARGQLRLQSDLESEDPQESAFLDTDYHYGQPELIQLEQVSGGWELVHYYHPWGARSDGAKTDGLERAVVIAAGVLINPKKVLTITGTYTNRFVAGSGAQSSQIAYAAFVEDPGTQGGDFSGGFLCIGIGTLNSTPPYNPSQTYPVEWQHYPLSDFLLPITNNEGIGEFLGCDVYTRPAYSASPAVYDAVQATQHLTFYYKPEAGNVSTLVASLVDTGQPGKVSVQLSALPNISEDVNYRVVDIDWNPTEPGSDGAYVFSSITLATSSQSSQGDPVISTASWLPATATVGKVQTFADSPNVTSWVVTYAGPNHVDNHTVTGDTAADIGQFDFSTVACVHTLFSTKALVAGGGFGWGDRPYRLVLAKFGSATLALFVLGCTSGSKPVFRVDGLFPLGLPDAASAGTISNLAGGVSKFGGFRFVASDEDGNVFLLRQQRLAGSDTPYPPAVYGPFTRAGTPRTEWNSLEYNPLPATTSAASPLRDLAAWVDKFAIYDSGATLPQYAAYNMLLSMLVGFGTDDSNITQGTWLGSTFKAAYALSRFGCDSEHVVVKAAQSGTAGDFAAYTMFCNPLTKVWHQRLIAQQVLPQPPGLNESGDHFQATVTPVNAYGHPVPVNTGSNTDYAIEVRADVPTEVIDDTHNLYYDVNQYSSFTAAPDPMSGQLVLLVKAETFAQALYLRPVFTNGLQPSGSDASLLKSIAETTFPWMLVNISAEAQQRMGNDGSASGEGDGTPIVDTTTYVSSDTLKASNSATPWDFKGGYNPSSSNLGDLASYMNTSGQNMISVAAQTTGTYADGTPVNPLSSLTPVGSGSALTVGTTTFGYSNGTVSHSTSTSSSSPAGLGGIFSGISHALHDALHWLQHVEGQAYKDLANGAVAVAIKTEQIEATVSADIMKQVNGIDKALTQVVSTIEEYANIVVNVLVTIVEDSFIYELIELIIALISLFQYFEDILKLSNDLHTRFIDILQGTNGYAIPDLSGWSTYDLATTYLGSGSQTESDLGSVDASSVPNSIEQGILDLVQASPLSKKILGKVMSEVSKFLNATQPSSPLSFNMGSSAAFTSFSSDLVDLGEAMVEGVADLSTEVATDLIEGLSQDIEQPQNAFTNMINDLADLTEQFAVDALEPVCDFIDAQVSSAPQVALDAIGQSGYITLKIPGLADLCKLFGIGDVSGNDLKLHAKDAVFFPMATIIWVTAYIQDGTKLKGISDLEGSTSAEAPSTVGSSADSIWEVASLVVDG
ncbi:MAG: hypothetical protein WBB15_01700, partial [Ornithinimicrobium sp.]